MALPTIKYFAIIRLVDNTILVTECTEPKNNSEYKEELKSVIKRLEEVDLQPDERQKIKSRNGAWFLTCDYRRIHYAVLADSEYPERHAYGLISDVLEQLQTLNDYYVESDSAVNNHTRRFVPRLVQRYSDLRNVDKLAVANEKVREIQQSASETIVKLLVNHDKLQEVEEKTEEMSKLAEGYYQNADELGKILKSRKRKMMIICVVVSVVIIAAVVLYMKGFL